MAEVEGNFLVENFFGEIYKGSCFDNDVRNFSLRKDKNELAEISAATAPVRMFNKVEVERESAQVFNEACRLCGDFANGFSNRFSGKIFDNI